MYVGLEHRFFGKSTPTSDTSIANLKYLTSDQALEDIITFKGYINNKHGLTSRNRWVSFGGGYSGALSAWLVEAHPLEFYAGVASSASIRAEFNFDQYMEVVMYALMSVSRACFENTLQSFMQLQEMASTPSGLVSLRTIFKFIKKTQPKEQQFLYTCTMIP